MSNTHYLLLITSKSKTVGVGEQRLAGVEEFVATAEDLNPNSTDTMCNGWGLKPLNLR